MAGSPPIQPPKPKPRRKAAGRADGGYKIAGTILPWDPDIDLDRPTPTPLFPVCQSSQSRSNTTYTPSLELQTHSPGPLEQCRKSPSRRLSLPPRPHT